MKYTLLFLILLIFSCSRPEQKLSPSLLLADSLLQTNQIDSALVILQNILPNELQTPASHARYALLMTQANDKNYITHTDDSLIRIAVDYYDSTNDVASQAKAHYYLGRVYQDMNCITDVVREFLTALPLAEKMNESRLMCLIYGNLGHLFWENGLFDEADSLYRKDISLARERKDSLLLASALATLSKICMDKGEEFYPEAEKCLNEANVIIKKMKRVNKPVRRQIMASLGYLYERTARPYEAISIIKEKMVLLPNEDVLCSDYLFIGSAYFEAGLNDSAKVYLNKSLYSDNFGVIAGAYMRLAEIANVEGKERDSLYYKDKYRAYNDSVVSQEVPVEIISLSKDFVHAQMVQQYKSSLNHSYYYLYVLGILVFALCVFVICYRKKEKRKVVSLLSDYESVSDQLEYMAKCFQEKEFAIQVMQEQNLANKKQINYCLTAVLEDKNTLQADMEKKLEEKTKIIEELSKRNFNAIMDETSIYKKIRELRKENKKNLYDQQKLTDSDWDDLEKEFCRLLPDFIPSLESRYEQLNQNDIRFLCLIKIGIGYQDMQYILCCSVATIYSREKTVKNRMKLEGNVKLKEFLEEFQ